MLIVEPLHSYVILKEHIFIKKIGRLDKVIIKTKCGTKWAGTGNLLTFKFCSNGECCSISGIRQGLLYRWTEHSILSMTTGGKTMPCNVSQTHSIFVRLKKYLFRHAKGKSMINFLHYECLRSKLSKLRKIIKDHGPKNPPLGM